MGRKIDLGRKRLEKGEKSAPRHRSSLYRRREEEREKEGGNDR